MPLLEGIVSCLAVDRFPLPLPELCDLFIVSQNPLQTIIESLNDSHISVHLTFIECAW
jgi:hypothetical protein